MIQEYNKSPPRYALQQDQINNSYGPKLSPKRQDKDKAQDTTAEAKMKTFEILIVNCFNRDRTRKKV